MLFLSSRLLVKVVLALALAVLAVPVLSATVWVDTLYALPDSDGTEARPYKTINQGITNATAGDTVQVKPGVYAENVVVTKNLTLVGTGPDTTIIKGNAGTSLLIRANFEVAVRGFTITGSQDNGITVERCTSVVSIVIANCVVVANANYGLHQDGNCLSQIGVRNCTFAANGKSGTLALGAPRCLLTNCLSVSSTSGHGFEGWGYTTASVQYCNAWNNPTGNYDGTVSADNTSLDPMFVDPDTGDYRLQAASPCRNSGTPDAASRNPDGTRNDKGAYGGPDSAGFYRGYGAGPVVTDLLVTPGAVPQGGTFSITARAKAQ